MIKYQLRCEHDHQFEAWFKDSATYDLQVAAGDVTCPYCNTANVRKAIMAPAIGKRSSESAEETPLASEPRDMPAPGQAVMASGSEEGFTRQVMDMMGKIRKHVESNFDYVGDNFANEARAIHHGDAEERGIYGEATPKESKELSDEGIDVFNLPFVDKEKAN